MLLSPFLGKPTEGVMTDPCKEVTPGSTKVSLSLPDQVNSHATSSPSEDSPKLRTHLNKTRVKLPDKDANYEKTPLSYEERPELWPNFEDPAPRPCLKRQHWRCWELKNMKIMSHTIQFVGSFGRSGTVRPAAGSVSKQ